MWRICVLYFARIALLLSVLLTAAAFAIWARSFWQGDTWTRMQWELSSDTDLTREMNLTVHGGRARLDHVVRVAPAFVAPFTGATLHQSSRTEPVGTRWLHTRLSPFKLGVGFSGNAPAMVQRVGVDWHPTIVQRTFGSYRDEWWFVCINLLWAIALCFAWDILTIRMWWRARRPFVRMRQGLCGRCGYDLRASVERCPECGGALPRSAAMAA